VTLSQAGPILADRLARRWTIEILHELGQIDTSKDFARRPLFVRFAAEHVDGQTATPPKPDFPHPELAVNIELVESPRRPNDFDGEIGLIGVGIGPEHVAFIRLDAASLFLVFERP